MGILRSLGSTALYKSIYVDVDGNDEIIMEPKI